MFEITGVNFILVFHSNYPCKKNVISFVVAKLKVKATFLLTCTVFIQSIQTDRSGQTV